MVEEDKLSTEELDNKEDNQEEKEIAKEGSKKSIKTIVISATCTLLFIIILILLLLLGLKKCAPVANSSSSSPSSGYTEIYDNKKLNNVFKEIVKNQRKIDTADADIISPKEVIAVTYLESNNKFNLDIIISTEDNRVFFYKANNCAYKADVTGYDNLVTYLLSNDEDQTLIFMGDGDISLEEENITTEVITTNKPNAHFLTSVSPTSEKHISGYYYQDNKYYVYNRLEYTDLNNPLGDNEGTLIDDTSLLYGCYLKLSGVITD